MKHLVISFFVLLLGATVFGCSNDDLSFDEYTPTMVWGSFYCDACTSGFFPEGTLGEGDEDYFGYCHRTESGLNFVVAQDDPSSDGFTSDFYYEVLGIAGPPSVGVYDEGESILDDPSIYTTFSSIKIMNTNVWYFDQGDISDQDQCYVRLFAEPNSGEMTPAEYGSNPFGLFVYIICTGIEVDSPQGSTLRSTSMTVWFDACEDY